MAEVVRRVDTRRPGKHPRLTLHRLEAIMEALAFRTAGPIDSDLPADDYDAAFAWAAHEATRRRVRIAERKCN